MDLQDLELPEGLAGSGAVQIAELLGTFQGGDVLDVGTGRGDLIETLSELLGDYSSFTGIDLNPEKLEKARESLEGRPVRFLEMDGRDMSFPDRSFDTVCISNSLHHLEDVDGVLAEMFRVLRPGGTFILQEMFCDGDQTPAQRTDNATHHWSARIDTLLGEFHRAMYTREEIRSAVESLDLADVTYMETTHGVSCLVCEDRFKCENPLHPEFVDHAVKEIEEDLDRLEGVEDQELASSLAEEGRALMGRVRETGVFPASTLFVIGRK
jgi:ubiquinone/menaquinone biosynthesis C-methylase UbiE